MHKRNLYAGEECEIDINGCADNPCQGMSETCMDVSPEEEQTTHIAYDCQTCSAGFAYNDGACDGMTSLTQNTFI